MDQKLKERLLGASIILSVMVVVLPILFKPQRENNPLLSTEDFDEDTVPSLSQQGLAVKQMALKQPITNNKDINKNNIKNNIKDPILDSLPKPKFITRSENNERDNESAIKAPVAIHDQKNWVLRVGIFTNPSNAKVLLEKLSAKGYPVYSKVDRLKDKKITRVFVGPKDTEYEIKKIRDHLKKDLKLDGIVLSVKNQEVGVF